MDRIILAAPRGFCAGVAYAIDVVDLALRIHGSPLFVRHAIVHNEYVVKSFEERGVTFVESLEEIPEGMPMVYSAHGVSPEVRRQAARRNLIVIDATCPLVTKVHNEVKHYAAKGYHMIYIGHKGHVEAEGTMGEAPDLMIGLVETPEEAEALSIPHFDKLAVVTQTTLSVDEVRATMNVLERKYPHIHKPAKEDICYATTNRQMAIRALAQQCDLVIVVGSHTSSNSNRLREVAEAMGTESYLIRSAEEVRPEWRTGYSSIGISSGASTPEEIVQDVIGALIQERSNVEVRSLEVVEEKLSFKPPRDLIELAMSR